MAEKGEQMRFSVEKFNGKGNFGLWQMRVKDLLVHHGLHRALMEKSKKPEKMTNEEWEDLDMRATSVIRLSLADSVVFNIIGEDTTIGLWEKLERLYLGKSLTTKLLLKQKLFSLKMLEGENLLEHLNVYNGILNQLLSIGVKMEEEDQALILLTSLPASYEYIVTTLLYGKDTIKVEDVTAALLSNEMRKAPTSEGAHLAVATEGRGRTSGKGSGEARSRSVSRKKGSECWYCKEFGHVRRDCPKRAEKKGLDAAIVVNGGIDIGEDIIIVSHDMDESSSEWILDSGCSAHACFEASWFTSLAKKNGIVRLGDDSQCEVVGIGTVDIEMFDGMICSLGGVLYVPKLKKNLISLGALDSIGCKWVAQGGVLEVTYDVTVLMKGKKCQGLYRLIGTFPMKAVDGRWKIQDGSLAVEQPSVARRRRVTFASEASTTKIPNGLGMIDSTENKLEFEFSSKSESA